MTPDDVRQNSRVAGQVKRYHTWPILRQQTNAEHCWQVNRIFLIIFGKEQMSADLFVYIQFHDAGELVTGDLPYPVKARNPELKTVCDRLERGALEGMRATIVEVSTEDRMRVKLCEMIEMWEYGMEELAMGNRFAQPIIDNCIRFISSAAVDLNVLSKVLEHIGDMTNKMR